jgi:hypothetical protein
MNCNFRDRQRMGRVALIEQDQSVKFKRLPICLAHQSRLSHNFVRWPATQVSLLFTVIGVALSLFLVQPRPATAHAAGKLHLASVPAGDFLLTVWTAPEPVRVGELHVIVGVSRASDGDVVLDDDLRIEVTATSGLGEPLADQATREKSDNKFLYEANLRPREAAWYQVSVSVDHPQDAGGVVAFNLEVVAAAGPNWLLIGLATLLTVIGVAAILVRSRRSAKAEARAPIR